ncbi:hypothetical protein CVIRNUC_008064 [Coccomyxa viridis]|uniref:Uncharacterized protein n=1 Tax=Coccomyxa viridis TaxID=1274662 RepID=A0AAV1IBZ0_9CHLO|nr:hypothetical protein CVIRNUC_008064 [Coccomyxa viridis]
MPPKQVAKSQDDDRAPENEAAWHESKRLQELAYKGMLSETRRMCTEEAVPSKVLLKADGKDIAKKSSLRKGRYLFNINAQIAGAAEGRMGALSQLDTKNPVLYLNFPEGRLKFLGTLMFPTNKYMVLKVGTRDILCEDLFDSMVVFSEAFWIGTKEENPQEHKQPMPMAIIEAGRKGQEAADASVVVGTEMTANGAMDEGVRHLGSQRKRKAGTDLEDSSSGNEDNDEENGGPALGRRMSQRSAAKHVNYNLDASDNEVSGSGDDSDNSEGGFQRLKRQAPPSAAARTSRVQSSQENASQEIGSSQREALPGSQTGRRRSITGGASGHLNSARRGRGGPQRACGNPDNPASQRVESKGCICLWRPEESKAASKEAQAGQDSAG